MKTILVFVEYIYESFLHIDESNRDVQEIKWTDRTNSGPDDLVGLVTTLYARDSQFKPSCGHWNL